MINGYDRVSVKRVRTVETFLDLFPLS